MDRDLRGLQRRFASGDVGAGLRFRRELKRFGEDAPLDLSLPHRFEVVEAKGRKDFGSTQALLRDLCRDDGGLHPFVGGIARPLTFRETVQARLDQYESTGKFGNLWTSYLDTSSAIVFKANSTKFKVVPLSGDLLCLPVNFRRSFLAVNYDRVQGIELDSDDDVYTENLTEGQVVSHKGWLAVLEGDRNLLRKYAGVVFAELQRRHQRTRGMQFWLVNTPKQDRLRALCAHNIVNNCYGYSLLVNGACFAWVRPL